MSRGDEGIVARLGAVEIDVPRTAGYYGGIAAALALGLIEWPVACLIAGIPLVKLLRRRDLSRPATVLVHLYEGASKPVGGDAEGTIRIDGARRRRRPQAESPLSEI